MLQIAIRLFSSRQFHRIIFHFQIFTVVESGTQAEWPSLEQCVSRSISTVINQTYREKRIRPPLVDRSCSHSDELASYIANKTNERGGKSKANNKSHVRLFLRLVERPRAFSDSQNIIWLKQTPNFHVYSCLVVLSLFIHSAYFPFQMNMWHVSVGDELHRVDGGEFHLWVDTAGKGWNKNWCQLNPNHF